MATSRSPLTLTALAAAPALVWGVHTIRGHSRAAVCSPDVLEGKPPRAAGDMAGRWRTLEAAASGAGRVQEQADLATLPAPVAAWLHRSIPVGAPLHRGLVLTVEGEVRRGSRRHHWVPFRASAVLAPPSEGLICARIGRRAPSIHRWVLPPFTAGLTLPLCPTAYDVAEWRGIDDTTAKAHLDLPGGPLDLTFRIDAAGHPYRVEGPVWVDIHREALFGPIRLPETFTVGRRDDELWRATVTGVHWL